MAKYQAYPEYKDSGIDWLGEIPEHWEVIPTKFLFDIFNGSTPQSSVSEYWDGDIIWVTPADLSKLDSVEICDSQRRITQSGLNSCGVHLVPKGSLILSCRAPIGSLAIAQKQLCTNQGCKSLVPRGGFDSRFFYYYLSVSVEQLNVLGRGTTFLELSSGDLGSFNVVMPSNAELDLIVDFLDYETVKIDQLIKKQLKLIDFLKEKRQALISSAVTKGLELNVEMKDTNINWLGKLPEHWRVNKLRNLFTLGTGLSITRANLTDEGVPCVSYGEVHSRYGFELDPDKDSLQCVDEKYLQTAPRALLNKGDFIFADTSEDLKGSGNFTHLVSAEKVFAGYHTIIVRPLDNAVSRFYAYLFESDVFRSQIQLAVKGVKVYSITQAILKNATVWLPPKEEKLEIANYLDEQTSKIDALIQKAESAISLMQERRRALISAAVTGKIDVRNWQAPVTSEVTE